MTPEQIRLEALRLAIPDTKILTPDTKLILARAAQYEAFIVGDAKQPSRDARTNGKAPADLPMGAQPKSTARP
jgi:hypothetical protein